MIDKEQINSVPLHLGINRYTLKGYPLTIVEKDGRLRLVFTFNYKMKARPYVIYVAETGVDYIPTKAHFLGTATAHGKQLYAFVEAGDADAQAQARTEDDAMVVAFIYQDPQFGGDIDRIVMREPFLSYAPDGALQITGYVNGREESYSLSYIRHWTKKDHG